MKILIYVLVVILSLTIYYILAGKRWRYPLYKTWWYWHNRSWRNCRHKHKQFKRDWKQYYWYTYIRNKENR